MIIQWTRNNWHKESFRVRTTNTIINFLEKNYVEVWFFSYLKHFLADYYTLLRKLGTYKGGNEEIDGGSHN